LTATTTGSASVLVNWTNPAGTLVNDTVYYSVGSGCSGPWTAVSVGVATNYSIGGLSGGVTYCFEVTAWTSGGESIPSSTATATTLSAGTIAPLRPVDVGQAITISTSGALGGYPASPLPAIDGWGSAQPSGVDPTLLAVSVTTSKANDLLVLELGLGGETAIQAANTIRDGFGLNWSEEGTPLEFLTSGRSGSPNPGYLYTFYALTESHSGRDTVSVNFSGHPPRTASAISFAVSNVYTTSPWDRGGPQTLTGTGTGASVSIATVSPDDLLVGFLGVNSNLAISHTGSFTPLATETSNPHDYTSYAEYESENSTGTYTSMPTWSGSQPYGLVVDALRGAEESAYSYAWTNLPPGCLTSNSPSIVCTPTSVVGSPFAVNLTVTDSKSNTAWSSSTMAVTLDPTVRMTAGLLSYSVGQSATNALTATLTYSGPNTASITVYSSADSSCRSGLTTVSTGTATLSFTPSTASAGATFYCATVTDSGVPGYTNYSNVAEVIVNGAPSQVTATALSVSEINLTWMNPAGSLTDNHVYEYAADCSTLVGSFDLGKVTTSYTLTGLSKASTYCFRVSASTIGGEGPLSPTASATTPSSTTNGWFTSPWSYIIGAAVFLALLAAILALLLGRKTVRFVAAGLPPGTSWAVRLEGARKHSTASRITFKKRKGRYPYSAEEVPGYTSTPQSGSVEVRQSTVDVPISFKGPPE